MSTGVNDPDLQQVWINKAAINYKVVGSSPLRLMEGEIIYAVVPSRESGFGNRVPDLPERPRYGEPHDYANSPSLGNVHAPGEPVGITISLKSTFLTPADVKGLEDGTYFLCVYGFMRYRDYFARKQRETRFCFACGNWGSTSPKAAQGYFVAGTAGYNDVMEFPWWLGLWDKAVRSYRKAKHQRQN